MPNALEFLTDQPVVKKPSALAFLQDSTASPREAVAPAIPDQMVLQERSRAMNDDAGMMRELSGVEQRFVASPPQEKVMQLLQTPVELGKMLSAVIGLPSAALQEALPRLSSQERARMGPTAGAAENVVEHVGQQAAGALPFLLGMPKAGPVGERVVAGTFGAQAVQAVKPLAEQMGTLAGKPANQREPGEQAAQVVDAVATALTAIGGGVGAAHTGPKTPEIEQPQAGKTSVPLDLLPKPEVTPQQKLTVVQPPPVYGPSGKPLSIPRQETLLTHTADEQRIVPSTASTPARPDYQGGQVSFAGKAKAGAVPNARQSVAGPYRPSEQEAKMGGMFVPASDPLRPRGAGVTSDNVVQSLKPALRQDDGSVLPGDKGQTHAEILQSAAKNGKLSDINAEQGFVDEAGKFLNRTEAAARVGETEPLHSERLKELQESGKVEEGQLYVKEGMTTEAQANEVLRINKELNREPSILGLDKPSSVGDVFRRIIAQPHVFGEQHVALARFLNEQFPHILDAVGVSNEAHPTLKRSAYNRATNHVHIDPAAGQSAHLQALHEGAHAAIDWLLDSPKTEGQRAAITAIGGLVDKARAALPAKVKRFFTDVYQPYVMKNYDSLDEAAVRKLYEEHGLSATRWDPVLYGLHDSHEFVAQVFNERLFRQHLNGIPHEAGGSVLKQAWSWFKTALGIKPGTALEGTFDALQTLGEESKGTTGGRKGQSRGAGAVPSEENEPAAKDVIWVADNIFHDMADARGDRTFKEKINAMANRVANISMPRTMAADKDAGNAGVRYAASGIASPIIARSLATQVLGKHWSDLPFINKLGAVLTQDRLNAIRQTHIENDEVELAQGVKNVWEQTDSPIHTKEEFDKALADPEIQAAIARHKELLEGQVTKRHVALGGRLARSGEESGAFINLIAMHEADMDPLAEEGEKKTGNALEEIKAQIYGARKGDQTNPLVRGSAFNKKAKGTAAGYDFNYRNIAERMVKANYEEFNKQKYYRTLMAKGLAIPERPGVPAPLIGGKPAGKVVISIGATRWGARRQINLWVREDLLPEMRQALNLNGKVREGAESLLAKSLVDYQLIGPTDVLVHLSNLFGGVSGTLGSGSLAYDFVRQIRGPRELDAIVRVVLALKDAYFDSPEVQKELADMAEIGSGRGQVTHQGWLSRAIPTAKIINVVDRAARLARNRLFDNLVEQGLAEDTEENRREFNNKLGQYNSRLQRDWIVTLKNWHISDFVVAGRAFNRLALERLILDPGLRAKNPVAAAKMRAVLLVGRVSTLMTLPIVLNCILNGNPFGRPGTPLGAVDLGTDDKKGRHRTIDMADAITRRGMRNVGLEAAWKGLNQQKKTEDVLQDAFGDMVRGAVSSFVGPAPRAVANAVTGHDVVTGYQTADNPDKLGSRLMAMLREGNPVWSATSRAKENESSFFSEIGRPFTRFTGAGEARNPSLFEREANTPGFDKMNVAQRVALQKQLTQGRTPISDKQRMSLDEAEARRKALVEQETRKGLSEENQTFLKKNKLTLPGFEEYLGPARARVYLVPKERERLMGIMHEEYDRILNEFKGRVEKQPTQELKQALLDKALATARVRGRIRMGKTIGQ